MEFTVDKKDWYTPQVVMETPNFDKDDYGNTWYSVKFTGDAGTHLWLAKNMPEEGKKYYGHFELTKSGKAYRFRTDKTDNLKEAPAEANPKQANYVESPEKQQSINRAVALNNAVLFEKDVERTSASGTVTGLSTNNATDYVLATADKFYNWLSGVPEEVPTPRQASTFKEKLWLVIDNIVTTHAQADTLTSQITQITQIILDSLPKPKTIEELDKSNEHLDSRTFERWHGFNLGYIQATEEIRQIFGGEG